MYFLVDTMKEIEKSEKLKFFIELTKKGWEFDFNHYCMKLKNKNFTYFLDFCNYSDPELSIYVDGKAIAGGYVGGFNSFGLVAIEKAMREIKKIAINAIKNNEIYFIKHDFYKI